MSLTCEYLVVGSGASAMAFVDTILEQTDASVVMVDERHVPGGHWNDVYPFVRIHQPAEFYGVASKQLGSNRVEESGLNAGMLELSSGVEIVAYYHHLMNEVFLPSGRVTYLPLTKYAGNGEVVSTLSGEKQTVEHTTLVDGTRLKSSIPSSHERKFGVADDVACIPPNRLPHLAGNHEHITVLGGGKTGCDSVTWLLSNGFPADRLRWVIPRDAWFWNRMSYQPGVAFFESTFASLAAQNEAMAAASSTEDLALGMERAGRWLRLDQHATPTMFHGGTISEAELEVLQSVDDVVRGRRVTQLDDDAMVLSDGERVVAEHADLRAWKDQPRHDPPIPAVLQRSSHRIHRSANLR